MITPFSLIKTPYSGVYDQNAQALFNIVNDIPTFAKVAWDIRVKAMKANGQWANSIGGYPFLPTNSATEVLRDAKRLILGNFAGEPDSVITGQITGGAEGINFFAGTAVAGNFGAGYIKTGIIPSTDMTLNNSAICIGTSRNEAGIAGLNFGSFQSSSQSILFQKRNAINQCFADMYASSAGGRVSQASGVNGEQGVYLLNRSSASDFRLYKNGTVIASATTSTGALPTVEMYLNTFNADGAPSARRNQPITFFWVYGAGMTHAQAVQENNDWIAFTTALERGISYTRNVVVDGNSHTVFFRSAFFRQLQFSNLNIGFNAKYSLLGVSGQATATLNENAAANVDPLYDTGVTKNLLVVWEATNDISSGIPFSSVTGNYYTYCVNRKNVGFKILAMPAMARDFAGDTTKILYTDAFNTWVEQNWPSFADAYLPPTGGTFGNNYFIPRSNYTSDTAYVTAILNLTNNPIYYSDAATHLTEFGYKEWGAAVAAKLLTM